MPPRGALGVKRADMAFDRHKIDEKKVEKLFRQYSERDSEWIVPEGVQSLCADLGIEPEDIKALLLAWKMEARNMGYFSKEEFFTGLRRLGADSLETLSRAIHDLDKELANPSRLQDFHRFAFKFCCTEPNQKTLDIETTIQMLHIVCPGRRHLERFCEYLREQKEYPRLTLDQWESFLRFSEEIDSDMTNYDENGSWPLLFDYFVEWARSSGGTSL